MNIILGSTSLHKIAAVEDACRRLGLEAKVTGIKTSSGQNEQPVGFANTYDGALARAILAKQHNPESIAVGIESGIFLVSMTVTLDIAVIVILSPDGKRIVTTTEGIEFPEICVQIAKERGFKTTTVGSVITEQLGGDPTDPHSVLTKGKVTRMMTLANALTTALQQL